LGVGDRPGSNLHWEGVGLVLIFFGSIWEVHQARGSGVFERFHRLFFYWDGSTRARAQARLLCLYFHQAFYRRDGTGRSHRIVLEHCTGSATRSKAKLPLHSYYSLIYRSRTSFTYFCASLYARMQARPARAFLCFMLRNLSAHRYQVMYF
jgi:hypothetical protein